MKVKNTWLAALAAGVLSLGAHAQEPGQPELKAVEERGRQIYITYFSHRLEDRRECMANLSFDSIICSFVGI